MRNGVDLKNKQFGRLLVLEYLNKEDREYPAKTWKCLCACGNEVHATTSHLKNGNVKSCGCLKEDTFVNNKLSSSLTYSSWHAMILRCTGYDLNYTNKDRRVCERWLEPDGRGFLNFLSDMGERPEGTTLERVNNSLSYFPENCVWDTAGNQAFNRDLFKNSTTGRTGIHERNGKWRAYINVSGKRVNLGTYIDFDLALEARQKAELEYYGFIKEF